MASLYDKLKQIQPIKDSGSNKPMPQELLVRTHQVPLNDLAPGLFDEDVFSFLSNRGIRRGFNKEDLLFFDTETTGLSRGVGTVAFLIGWGRIVGDVLKVTQALMRDYPQEHQLLKQFQEELKEDTCLVSYNGKSFDLPLLQSRLTMNRSNRDLAELPHLDLLHAAKRTYKLRLGRTPLTRLEQLVLGFERQGDLPGAEVPVRYFKYLETREESLLEDILDHNRQDIITLAKLFLNMGLQSLQPLNAAHQEDLFSIGRVYEKHGQYERAITCYKACSDQVVSKLAMLQMAELYRKQRKDEEAVAAFEALQADRQFNPRVFISLAKLYEHRYRDPARALEITRQGMLYCYERIAKSTETEAVILDLERRSLRLIRKVTKQA